jgi:hypothetical protein
MNNNQDKIFAILIFVLVILLTFTLFSGSGYAMRSRLEMLSADPVYLPVIFKNYPLQNVFGITLYSLDEAGGLAEVAGAGTVWTRNSFVWEAIEPVQSARNWDPNLEQGLITADLKGVQPIMLIEGTPHWALKDGYSCGAVATGSFTALGQFAYDLVARYSVPPYNVRYWELWNEPDVAGSLGCWGDPHDPLYYGGGYYGEMLKVVYPRIKEADPKAQVLVGGLLLDCDPQNPPVGKDCVSSKFLEGILASGAGPYFDGVSFHAYDFFTGKGSYANDNWHSSSSVTGPASIAKTRFLKDVLAEYGYGQKFLVSTETAVFWGPNVMDPPCGASSAIVPDIEVTKVDYVIQSYAVAVAEGWKANVWYSAFGVRCSGLLNIDLTPKPAFFAYQFASQKLSQALFIRPISEYPEVMGYEYEITGRKLWVLWSLDGQPHQITLLNIPVEVNLVGEDGVAVPEPSPSTTISIDLSPRFIEFVR